MVRIDRSLVAGVPVSLQLELGHQTAGTSSPSSVRGEMQAGGNRLSVDGQGQPAGDGRADRLQFDLQAPNLATLAPMARLMPEWAAWAPRAGAADAQISVEGRWPDIRSEGTAKVQGLQAGALSARQAQAQWRFDTANDQPLLLQADGLGLVQGQQQLEKLTVDLRGTWREHQLALSAAVLGNPSPALEVALGLRTGAGTLAQLRSEGHGPPTAMAAGAGPGAWRS